MKSGARREFPGPAVRLARLAAVGRLFDWASRLARRTYAYIPTFEPAVRRLSSSMFAPGSVPPDPRPLNGLDEDKR